MKVSAEETSITETARAITQQDRHVGRGKVGRDYVLIAIPVEIAHRHRVGCPPDIRTGSGTETARAIAQQDRDVVWTAIGHDQVLVTVAIEIAHRYSARLEVNPEVG